MGSGSSGMVSFYASVCAVDSSFRSTLNIHTDPRARATLTVRLGKRKFIRVNARHLDWDAMQAGFCSKYRDGCKKTKAADRPIQVIACRAE